MTIRALFVVAAFLVVFVPVESQKMQEIAEHVHVLASPGQVGTTSRNIGVVEFDDYLLGIDACAEEDWETLSEGLRGTTEKPVRYLAHTHGTAADDCWLGASGVTHLTPTGSDWAEFRDGNPLIASDVVLEDGTSRAVLRRVHAGALAEGWTVFVSGSKVLFAGDLVGEGGGSQSITVEDWTSELLRLSRLSPDVVIPGSGPIGNLALLRDTYGALSAAENAFAGLLDRGSSREGLIDVVKEIGRGLIPDAAVERLVDEHIGIIPAAAFVEEVGLREGPSPTRDSPGWIEPRRVVVADLWPGRTAQIGLAAPGVEVLVAKDTEHAAELVQDADAILGWLTPEILDAGEHLRWVALLSAGIESYLALPGFAESDIVLTNGQRMFANGGAEHVLGMVLSLSRRLHTAVRLQSERRWDTTPLTGPTPITGAGSELGELRGKTILVAGLGGIGTEVARLAHGIGMRVLATRASRREGPHFVEYVGLADELPTLALDADVIVNCLPLTSETEMVFDEEFFSTAKPSAFFVNIGRGKTVDTAALAQALREGRIAGAGLDVTEPEPLPADHELWGLPNVIITPHIGGDSEKHMERIWLLFRENLRRFAAGERLLSVVDKSRGY